MGLDIRKGVVVSRTNLVESKREAAVPWKGVLFVIFFTLLLWGGIFLYHDLTVKKVNELQNSINSLKQGRDYQKIAYVADSENRLTSINKIVQGKTDWELILQKLEENTLPEITYNNMDAKLVIQKSQIATSASLNNTEPYWQLELKGTTVGINNLSKQIMVLEGSQTNKINAFAQDVKIEKIDIKKTETGGTTNSGALDFVIQVILNPNILNTTSK